MSRPFAVKSQVIRHKAVRHTAKLACMLSIGSDAMSGCVFCIAPFNVADSFIEKHFPKGLGPLDLTSARHVEASLGERPAPLVGR